MRPQIWRQPPSAEDQFAVLEGSIKSKRRGFGKIGIS
jgi:hypothetical protein